ARRRASGRSLTVPALLEVDADHVHYGPIHAVKGISFTVNEGEIVTLIGANGAGKSSTLRAVTGLVAPSAGRIRLGGVDVTGWKPERVLRAGAALVPE